MPSFAPAIPVAARPRVSPPTRRTARLRLQAAAWLGLVAWLAAGCGNAREPARGSRWSARAVAGSPATSDEAKRQAALDVLERFVPHAEGYWKATSDLREPRTGYYDAIGSGVTQPRGAGDIAFAYATLLEARPDQASFAGVPREVLIDHTIQSIRHEALTSALSGAGYDRWGKGTWQASLETAGWAFAAWRLWAQLDDDTRALVRRVVTGEASILVTKAIASGEWGDTGAEDNGWNSTAPALAAVMFPDDAAAPAWEQAVIRLAINASSIAADATSEEPIDGQPLRAWVASVNLHPDLSMENHGFFNPIYQQVTHVDIGEAAIAYAAAGHPLPQALSFRTETIWEDILGRLATDEGDLAQPAGQDWISKDFQHLDYLAILATRFQRADASVLESRALALVARRQATHADGSVLGQAQVGYETMLVKRMASVWWNHHLFGPSPEPSVEAFAAARAATAGVKQFPYSDLVAARLGDAFASISWSSARPVALLVPGGAAFPDDPVFSYYAPQNLLGAASGAVGPHSCACGTDRFSCAGTIGARRFSMTAFPDGTTLLLDEGQGSAFTYSLESIPGVTGERPIWSSGGSGLGTLSGDWVNAADRLGLIVRGGDGISAASVAGTNPTVLVTGSVGTGTGRRAAVLLPLADHARTAALAPFAAQLATPEGWAGVAGRAADGAVRLAVARWAGTASADLQLPDERGAPVPEQDATLEASAARFTVGLAPAASRGQILRFFIAAAAPLRGHQDGEDAALLRNPGDQPVAATVTYLPASGAALTATRTLAPGEEVRARVVGGELSLAGPELEALLEARAALGALRDELQASNLPRWAPQRWALLAAAQLALAATEDAIAQARAAAPEVGRAAVDARLARLEVEVLERLAGGASLPAELRERVLAQAEAAEAALDEALDEGYVVQVALAPEGAAQPGERLPVRVSLFDRSAGLARDGVVTFAGPDGWARPEPTPAFTALRPGATATVDAAWTVPASAVPGSTAVLHAELEYRHRRHTHRVAADLAITISPVLELSAGPARLPVGLGGVSRAQVHVVNHLPHALDVTVTPGALAGVALTPPAVQLTVPAASSADAEFALTGALTSGTGALVFSATSSTGITASAGVELHFSDDLARNDVGAPWPAPFASSNQPAYPAYLAFDGSASTFWVSSGTAAGQGPSASAPEYVGVDLGAPTVIGSVTMVPRVNYGPKAYAVEVSDDGQSWREVAAVPAAANATVKTTLTPVTARAVRLRITDGYDRIRPPRNVQVSSLEVRAP